MILLTGATGFVGKNLLNYLEDTGFECLTVDRNSLQTLNQSSLFGANVIVHLAGKAHDLKTTQNPDEYYQVNFETTKKVYDAFLISDAKKFIFISSVKAAADSVDGILLETVNSTPQTHYGRSKLMAEEYISSMPRPLDKSYYILRPCMIHGPGNKGNLNLLYKFVKRGIPYPLAGFNNKRSFLTIENLCFIIREIINNNCIESGIYNVSDDEALSTNEVVSLLASSLNLKPKLWKISPAFITLLTRIGDMLHLPLTTERLKKLT